MKHVEEFMIQDTKFNGQENNGTALELKTTLQIIDSKFVSNRIGLYRRCVSKHGYYRDRFIGGAIIDHCLHIQ